MENRDFIFKMFPNERYMDLTLIQYGWERCSPNHSYGPATRSHYLLHYIISGKGILYSNDAQGNTHIHHLGRNQAFLICPNQVNTYIADSEEPWEYTWLEFDGLRVKEFLDAAGLGLSNPIYKSNDRELRDQMKNEMLTIVHNQDKSSLYLIGHLFLFLDLLVRSSFNHQEIRGAS